MALACIRALMSHPAPSMVALLLHTLKAHCLAHWPPERVAVDVACLPLPVRSIETPSNEQYMEFGFRLLSLSSRDAVETSACCCRCKTSRMSLKGRTYIFGFCAALFAPLSHICCGHRQLAAASETDPAFRGRQRLLIGRLCLKVKFSHDPTGNDSEVVQRSLLRVLPVPVVSKADVLAWLEALHRWSHKIAWVHKPLRLHAGSYSRRSAAASEFGPCKLMASPT